MSYTNGTPFLNLPQTIGEDHRDWFDTNESFLELDTKVKTLWDDSGSAASAIDALQEAVTSLQTDLLSLTGTVNTHTSALSTINEALVLINSTLSGLDTSVKTKFDSAGIADPYDADHGIYDIGDVVTYNGQRYVCNTAVTAAEPFDADKWTAKDIQSELDQINSDLSELDELKPITYSITADGVKSFQALLGQLYRDNKTSINNLPTSKKRTMSIDGSFGTLHIGAIGTNVLEFYGIVHIPDTRANMTIRAAKLQDSDSSFFEVTTDFTQTPSVTTITNRDNDVPTSGDTITIYVY